MASLAASQLSGARWWTRSGCGLRSARSAPMLRSSKTSKPVCHQGRARHLPDSVGGRLGRGRRTNRRLGA
eukprot:14547761-Alexandrium_andersonii.AAC.1